MTHTGKVLSVLGIGLILAATAALAEPAKVLELWPGLAPGDKGDIGEEHDTTKLVDRAVAGKAVIRTGNVSKPSLTVFRQPRRRAPEQR